MKPVRIVANDVATLNAAFARLQERVLVAIAPGAAEQPTPIALPTYEDEPELPEGGTTGELLAKASGDDFDVEWVAAPTGGGATFFDGGNASSVYTGPATLDGGGASG